MTSVVYFVWCFYYFFSTHGKMTNVRLSNGSPTLERMDAGFSDNNPKPSFCKNLFGSLDHDEWKRDYRQHLLEMEHAASAKWNFDFKNDKPLPGGGRFEWESEDGNNLPEFYSRPPRDSTTGTSCRTGNNNNSVDLNGNNHNCAMGTPGDTRLSDEKTAESESRMDCRDQRKRAPCREQTSQNKRSRTSSDEVLTHSVEHTPRKPSPKAQT